MSSFSAISQSVSSIELSNLPSKTAFSLMFLTSINYWLLCSPWWSCTTKLENARQSRRLGPNLVFAELGCNLQVQFFSRYRGVISLNVLQYSVFIRADSARKVSRRV